MVKNKIVEEIDSFGNINHNEILPEKETIDLNIPNIGTLLFYGKTMSGKTTVMKKLLYENARKFAQIYIFYGSTKEDWTCLDKRCIFKIDETLETKLQLIMKSTEKLKEKNKHTLIILDDPFNSKAKYHNSKIWDELASMSRHCLISIWMAVQNPGHIPPILKSNVVGYFITKVAKQALNQIYEYSYGFENKIDFINFITEHTMKGKVFYNDCLDAYATDSYSIINIPYPIPKFKIVLK